MVVTKALQAGFIHVLRKHCVGGFTEVNQGQAIDAMSERFIDVETEHSPAQF